MSKHWKLIIIALALWSCNNEIKITAPRKETIVVYGLLDPAAPVNYIRIQKAFLDPDGNAFQFTGTSDSIYPDKDNLDVKLIVRQNDWIIDTIFPQLINGENDGIKKDTGLFSSSPNFLFKITDRIFDSRLITGGREDYEYELKVKNRTTGYECSSKTHTNGLLESLAPVSPGSKDITINDKNFLTIYYREGRFVKTYDLIYRFWYKEIQISDTSIKTTKSFDWVIFKNKPTKSMDGYNTELFAVSGSIFYEILNAHIKPNPKVKREALYCDVEYYGAGEDLYTFVQVNQPSIGIVQKKPEYTNITNGLGVFSSRYITSIKKVPISSDMKSILRNSNYTVGLNF